MEERYKKFYRTFDKRFRDNENLILCSNTLCDGGVGSTGWFIEPSTQTSSLKKIKSCNKIVENTYDFIERNHV